MENRFETEGGRLTAYLNGDLNTITAPDLDEQLKAHLSGISDLTIDFSGCEYVSSAGLRVLLSTHKAMLKNGGTMRITNIGDFIREVLENTGLDSVLNIE